MTLGELIDRYRPYLQDESVGVRRSWEDTFRYTLMHFPPETELDDFDPYVLSVRLADDGMQSRFVDGYVERWRSLLSSARQL